MVFDRTFFGLLRMMMLGLLVAAWFLKGLAVFFAYLSPTFTLLVYMFGFFENEQAKKIKGHLHNLAALAKADGHVDDREMNFIITVGKKNGMSASDVRKIIGSNDVHTPDLPHNDSERFDQIFDLVDMMLADGIVDETEMDFCVDMAEKLGFRKAIVGVLVRKISQGVKDAVPRERIKEESLSFLNYNNLPPR